MVGALGIGSRGTLFKGPNLSMIGMCSVISSIGELGEIGELAVSLRARDARTSLAADSSIVPWASAFHTLSMRAALSVGSAQLVYWSMTSLISPLAAAKSSRGK